MRELESRLWSHEISEWIAFDRIEPIGREFYQTGILASLQANINRDDKKKNTPFEPEDFMPIYRTPEEVTAIKQGSQTWQQQLAFVEMLNKRFGGKDLRPGKGG